MPSLVKLGLALFTLTLVVPALVWAQSTSWRAAFSAWKVFAGWMGALLLVGLIVWAATI